MKPEWFTGNPRDAQPGDWVYSIYGADGHDGAYKVYRVEPDVGVLVHYWKGWPLHRGGDDTPVWFLGYSQFFTCLPLIKEILIANGEWDATY